MIMKCRKYLKQFIPPICCQVYNCLIKKTSKKPEISPLPIPEITNDKLIIIGNGPSLNSTMEKYEKEVCSSECLMVNEAALTSLYDLIKPSIYMLVDPKYYLSMGYESYHETLKSLVDVIVSKTDWTMKIIMPKCAQGCFAEERFKENSNLDVLFYEDGWLLPKGISKFEAWDKNLICPPAQTVLNTAVWLSIYWGYKVTYLVGADTSFIQDIYVGQKDNVLYTIDSHFYKNEDVYNSGLEPEKKGRKFGMDMEQLLESVYVMFKSYRELREYAEWKGVKIYNASEYSIIDCLERKKLNV